MYKIMKFNKTIRKLAFQIMILSLKDNLLIIKTINNNKFIKTQVKKNIFIKPIFILVHNKQKFR